MSEDGSPKAAVIEFSGRAPARLQRIADRHPTEVVLLRTKGFNAPEYTIQVLIAVVPVTIKVLAPIIRAHIESRQRVRVKVDGSEFEGRPDDIIAFLEDLAATGNRE